MFQPVIDDLEPEPVIEDFDDNNHQFEAGETNIDSFQNDKDLLFATEIDASLGSRDPNEGKQMEL